MSSKIWSGSFSGCLNRNINDHINKKYDHAGLKVCKFWRGKYLQAKICSRPAFVFQNQIFHYLAPKFHKVVVNNVDGRQHCWWSSTLLMVVNIVDNLVFKNGMTSLMSMVMTFQSRTRMILHDLVDEYGNGLVIQNENDLVDQNSDELQYRMRIALLSGILMTLF